MNSKWWMTTVVSGMTGWTYRYFQVPQVRKAALPTILIVCMLPGLAAANWEKPDVTSWHGKPLNEVSVLAIEAAAQSGGGFSPEAVGFLYTHYLADPAQIESAEAADLFKLISSIIPQLTTEQRKDFALMCRDVVLDDPEKAADGASLVLLGWSLVNSGLAGEGKAFPRFTEAALAFASGHDDYGFAVRELQHGVAYDDHAMKMAMTTYLSPFWHDDVKGAIDDNACPFYRFLLGDDRVAWDYAASYFLAAGIGDDATRDRVFTQAVEGHDVPRIGLLKLLTWSSKRADQLEPWQARLDAQLEQHKEPGDAQAAWRAGRGFAEEVTGYFPSPSSAQAMNHQAWQAAQSPEFRGFLGLSYAQREAALGRFDEALALIQAVSDEDVPDLDAEAIRQHIEAQAAARLDSAENVQLRQSVERIEGRIRMAKRSLAEAEAAGQPEEQLDRLRQMVFDLEEQLTALTNPSPETE